MALTYVYAISMAHGMYVACITEQNTSYIAKT
jgi:hypothetical protein